MSLRSGPGIDELPSFTSETLLRYLSACEMAVGFFNGLPDVESFMLFTEDADWMTWREKCKETLRAMKSAKLVVLRPDDVCGCQL